jgi:DNA polymerase-1
MKGKGFYVPFPENQVEAKALAEKFMPFSKTKNREKWTEFEI